MSNVKLYYSENGLGSMVSRVMKNEYFTKFIDQHRIKTVLEAPLEDLYPVQGVASMIFALKGCRVTLVQPSEDILNKARHSWIKYGKTLLSHVKFVKSDLKSLPFDSDSFDLVWSYDMFAKLTDPPRYIQEAARVSRKFVYMITPNKWNYGYPIHKIHQFVTKQKSEFGSECWMTRRAIKDAMRNAGLNIVEEGVHDVPPWPGFIRLYVTAKKSTESITIGRKVLGAKVAKSVKKFMFIERSSLPLTLKLLFAHSVYVLGEKKKEAEI